MKRLFLPVILAIGTGYVSAVAAPRVIDAKRYHLGIDGLPEWQEFELSTPHFMEYYEYLPDSAGAGRWRGGLGTTSSWRFYGEGELGVSIGDDAASEGADPAAGLFGSKPLDGGTVEADFYPGIDK